jgi:hypothetical protein
MLVPVPAEMRTAATRAGVTIIDRVREVGMHARMVRAGAIPTQRLRLGYSTNSILARMGSRSYSLHSKREPPPGTWRMHAYSWPMVPVGRSSAPCQCQHVRHSGLSLRLESAAMPSLPGEAIRKCAYDRSRECSHGEWAVSRFSADFAPGALLSRDAIRWAPRPNARSLTAP